MKKNGDDSKLKSWVLLVAGLAGIGYQQYTGKVNWLLLLTFTIMAGVPSVANILLLLKNSPIVLQSSSSQQEHLEPDSANVSPKSLEDEE